MSEQFYSVGFACGHLGHWPISYGDPGWTIGKLECSQCPGRKAMCFSLHAEGCSCRECGICLGIPKPIIYVPIERYLSPVQDSR